MGALLGSNFGSAVDPSKAKYDLDTGEPENLEALKLDAEYDPETGEPVNESAKKLEQMFEEESEGFDLKKYTDILSESDFVTSGKPTSNRPLFTQRPESGPRVPTGSVGYRPTQSPYQVPSYLMSSAQYNEQISKMLGGLLSRSIRSNPIKLLV